MHVGLDHILAIGRSLMAGGTRTRKRRDEYRLFRGPSFRQRSYGRLTVVPSPLFVMVNVPEAVLV